MFKVCEVCEGEYDLSDIREVCYADETFATLCVSCVAYVEEDAEEMEGVVDIIKL